MLSATLIDDWIVKDPLLSEQYLIASPLRLNALGRKGIAIFLGGLRDNPMTIFRRSPDTFKRLSGDSDSASVLTRDQCLNLLVPQKR
jgi:hypothetical protein